MTLPDPLTSRAILIGVGEYSQLPRLATVRQNITSFREVLTSEISWNLPPENCITVHNPKTPEDLVDPIHQCAQEATDALLVYYAGHGIRGENRGEFRLARSTSRTGAPHTSTDFNDVREALLESAAPRRIVILDCCFAASAIGVMSGATYLADQALIEGTYLIAATGETQAAIADDGNGFTVFTGELIDVLRNGIPDDSKEFIDLDSIYDHLLQSLRSKARPLPHRRVRDSAGRLALSLNKQWVGRKTNPAAGRPPTFNQIDSPPSALSAGVRAAPRGAELSGQSNPAIEPTENGSSGKIVSPPPGAWPLTKIAHTEAPFAPTDDPMQGSSPLTVSTTAPPKVRDGKNSAASEPPPPEPGSELGYTAQGSPLVEIPRTLPELINFWPKVLEAVKEHRRFAWIILSQNAAVTHFDGKQIILEFDTKNNVANYRESQADKSLEYVVREIFKLPWVIEARSKTAPTLTPTQPYFAWSHKPGEWPVAQNSPGRPDFASQTPDTTRQPADNYTKSLAPEIDNRWSDTLAEVGRRRRFALVILNNHAELAYFGEYTVLLLFTNEAAFKRYHSSGAHALLEATLCEIFQRPYYVEACINSKCMNI
ncbi:caspase family protein [Streptomyces sp. NPDC059389]|uniref:caspase, EACC1-associated type n=1 Tax=Streptomyces sp. NPDC059389 TaxID=3346818 RepID=UPI0036B212F3